MEYRLLGRTGLKVSSLCLGTSNFADPTPEKECIAIVNRAIEAGINLIDTGEKPGFLRHSFPYCGSKIRRGSRLR